MTKRKFTPPTEFPAETGDNPTITKENFDDQ